MFQDERLKKYELEKAEKLAPKEEGGLNIEGLTATPNGELLIGFRNPIPGGKALILPLTNPLDLIQKPETEVNAIFGEPIELDLGGLGIRSIEYWQVYQVYLIIAGAYDGSDQFALYGCQAIAKILLKKLNQLIYQLIFVQKRFYFILTEKLNFNSSAMMEQSLELMV
jgi:hypothetical protein